MASAQLGGSAPGLEASDNDAIAYSDEVRLHVESVRRHGLHRPRRHGKQADDGAENAPRRKMSEFLNQAVLGLPPSDGNEHEVGDEFFQPPETRKGIVRLTIGGAQSRVKRLGGALGSRRRGHGKASAPKMAKSDKPGNGVPGTLHAVEEEAAEHQHQGHGMNGDAMQSDSNRSPIYPNSSLAESPTDSLDSLVDESDAATTVDPSVSGPPTPMMGTFPSPSPQLPLRRRPSEAETVSSSLYELEGRVSRTLTIDDSVPSNRRRRHHGRSLISKGKRLAHHADPRDFHNTLLRRRHKTGINGSTALEEIDNALDEALWDAGAVADEEEKYEVDILWENQRGFVLFGDHKFSAAALAQFDPAPWTDAFLRKSPHTPHDHPLPSPYWKWDHTTWLIDMSGDVDESGWRYARRFRSSHWRGQADGWRSFVRRRRWVRGRYYRPEAPPKPARYLEGENAIDWEALSQAVFEAPTSGTDIVAEPNQEGLVTGLKAATALLPLSSEHKDDIFCWENELDAQDPFLAWSFVKYEGERILKDRRKEGRRSDEELLGVWRDAVVEINYRRIARVMKACRLDREKVAIWRWWLGQPVVSVEEVEKRTIEEGTEAKKGVKRPSKEASVYAPNAIPKAVIDARDWDEDGNRPNIEDVWDLVEGRLDRILQLFEFQMSRLHLLRLVLSLHPAAHAHHRYRSWDGKHSYQPEILSPKVMTSRLGRRIDFYSDVKELHKFYDGDSPDAIRSSLSQAKYICDS